MSPQRVAVVGAGIAGLAAGSALLREHPGLEVVVLDAAPRAGGKLMTSEIAGVAVDAGAEAFLVRDPAAAQLVQRVGLGHLLVHPVATSAGIWVDGAPRPVPRGTVMGVPSRVDSLAGLLRPQALSRATAGAGRSYAPIVEDVSIGSAVSAQLGPDVTARAVEPLLGGVYAGRADELSLQATVPALATPLRADGSLVRAAAAVAPAPSEAAPAPVFGTLVGGLGQLVDVLTRELGDRVRLSTAVRQLRRSAEGFRLVTGPVPAPQEISVDAVVLAVPAAPAARLLGEVAPAAGAALSTVDYASTALITLAYPSGTVLPAGSGLLVPADQGFAVKALTYSGQKWAHLSGGPVIVRASVGRFGDVAVLQRDDQDLVGLVTTEVARLTGVQAGPIAARVSRWGGALPQYAVGHLDRVRRATDAVAAVPGLAVAGAAYGGVGIPACVRSGQAAATRVAEHLARAAQSGHG